MAEVLFASGITSQRQFGDKNYKSQILSNLHKKQFLHKKINYLSDLDLVSTCKMLFSLSSTLSFRFKIYKKFHKYI